MRAGLKKAAEVVGGGLFATLFLVFLVQITARFGFNKPLAWTDELVVILYVWVILWACAFVVPEREHVVFDLVWNSVGPRARQAMRIGGHLMIGGLSAVAVPLLRRVLRTTPLTLSDWGVVLAAALTPVVVVELVKGGARWRNR